MPKEDPNSRRGSFSVRDFKSATLHALYLGASRNELPLIPLYRVSGRCTMRLWSVIEGVLHYIAERQISGRLLRVTNFSVGSCNVSRSIGVDLILGSLRRVGWFKAVLTRLRPVRFRGYGWSAEGKITRSCRVFATHRTKQRRKSCPNPVFSLPRRRIEAKLRRVKPTSWAVISWGTR